MHSEFSPFDKDISDLQVEDLHLLKSIHEGWYVEYKRELNTASAMAKAISAFANTYGGWLFLGIDEVRDAGAVAGNFVGIPQQTVNVVLQQLRQSASSSLNPTPYFRTKVLNGPCPTIHLASKVSIVVVQIPSSRIAPHVHKNGRIYRRVADGSEPKPETDRFVLDQMWRRGVAIRKATRKWIRRDPEFSEAEETTPYLRLLLCVDPWQQRDPWLKAPISEIRRIFHGNEASVASMPFETIYSSTGGIVARQLGQNDPELLGLTWKTRRDLSCDISFPLPFHVGSPDELESILHRYDHIGRFVELLHTQGSGYSTPKVVDLNQVLQFLIAVVAKYRELLTLATDERTFYLKTRLLHCWRTIPFVDVVHVLDIFETHGVPMVLNNTLTAPAGYDPDSFTCIAAPESDDEIHPSLDASISQGISAFIETAIAFGVPTVVGEKSEKEDSNLYQELFNAGNRAKLNSSS